MGLSQKSANFVNFHKYEVKFLMIFFSEGFVYCPCHMKSEQLIACSIFDQPVHLHLAIASHLKNQDMQFSTSWLQTRGAKRDFLLI